MSAIGSIELGEIEGDLGPIVIKRVTAVSPALAQSYVRVGYVDMLARPTLSNRRKSIVALAQAVSIDLSDDALDRVLHRAMSGGLSNTDIELIVCQLAAYVGYHRAIAGMLVLARVAPHTPAMDAPCNDQDDDTRYHIGTAAYAKINPMALDVIKDAFATLAPDLDRTTFTLFGDVFARTGLELPDRQIATVASLTALGGAEPQLVFHIRGALDSGVTREELVEVMIQSQFHVGLPRAYNGLVALKNMLAEVKPSPAYS